ncbi:MAG TPA: cytochrome C oxidase subunit III [Casimicrobiaceae bacterium]|nr:cytochrome C oxidase subunit III [Casimicrobiaceae bacterium]
MSVLTRWFTPLEGGRREATPASVPAVRKGDALDVAELPSYGFGTRSLMWWGTAGMMAIEGMGFALMIGVCFYLRSLNAVWPSGGDPPDLLWGTVNVVLAVLTGIPNAIIDRAANEQDLHRVRVWLVTFAVLTLCLLPVRWMEFTALNVRGDASAYGSCVWVLLGLHTFNLITNVADTLVVSAVTFKKTVDGKRFVDVAENAGYWWFIIATWIPIYVVIYLVPRM